MEKILFESPAEVFVARGRQNGRMIYLRFNTGAEAIRYVMEQQDNRLPNNAVVEIDGERFDQLAVAKAYGSPDYPLPRRSETAVEM